MAHLWAAHISAKEIGKERDTYDSIMSFFDQLMGDLKFSIRYSGAKLEDFSIDLNHEGNLYTVASADLLKMVKEYFGLETR